MDDAGQSLAVHFSYLALPPEASAWLLDIWQMIQAWDDVTDADAIEPARVNQAIWASFVTMPANPFYLANAQTLQAGLATAVLKWNAANEAEHSGKADARSFMWRAGYYDLVLLVVLLTKGHAAAMKDAMTVMHLYGETLPDYMKEFPSCPHQS